VTRLCERIHAWLGHALVALVAIMTLTVGWQVASRLLARLSLAAGWPLLVEPSRWTEELAGFQLAWVALLGAAYALRRREHLGFDLFYLRLGPGGRRLADALVAVLVGLFSAVVLCYGGTHLVLMTRELGQRTAALGWPMAFIYTVVPVAGALFVLFAAESLVRCLRREDAR
jgi:TRAP-type C4-dicarboxylate transport system permease small subunit